VAELSWEGADLILEEFRGVDLEIVMEEGNCF
jgi:hypothetical protein